MKRYLFCFVLLVGCSTMNRPKGVAAPQAFDEMKTLVGKWEGTEIHEGKEIPITITYDVRSNGSILVENLFPGSEKEMISVYHRNGDKVEMTHYCSIGNQPNLVMTKVDGPTKYFEFAGASNMKSPDEMHIHSLELTRVDEDTMTQHWTAYQGGKPMPSTQFTLKRVK